MRGVPTRYLWVQVIHIAHLLALGENNPTDLFTPEKLCCRRKRFCRLGKSPRVQGFWDDKGSEQCDKIHCYLLRGFWDRGRVCGDRSVFVTSHRPAHSSRAHVFSLDRILHFAFEVFSVCMALRVYF